MKPLRIFVFSKPQSIPPKKTFVCVCVYGFCFNSVLFFFFICGFNICPEILWCPSVQEMECNSLPPECRLGLVIGLLWIKYGRGKIIILQWRSPVNTTSRLMSPGITHVDIITLIRRDEKNTSPVWYSFLKVITSKLIIRKTEIWGQSTKPPDQYSSKMYQGQELPGSPVVRTQRSHCWGLGLILVGELRSHKPYGVGKKTKIKCVKDQNRLPQLGKTEKTLKAQCNVISILDSILL